MTNDEWLVPTLCVGTPSPTALSPRERLTVVFPRRAWEQANLCELAGIHDQAQAWACRAAAKFARNAKNSG